MIRERDDRLPRSSRRFLREQSRARMGLSDLLGALLGRMSPSRPADAASPDDAASPGRRGDPATVEVDPRLLRREDIVYAPQVDGAPDPGEVVWTWVPFEEGDGRGKDRPVVIVSRESESTVFGVYLTSKPHAADPQHFVFLGPGGWDGQGRPSWARLDRVFRVSDRGMRREAAALSGAQFTALAQALAAHPGRRG